MFQINSVKETLLAEQVAQVNTLCFSLINVVGFNGPLVGVHLLASVLEEVIASNVLGKDGSFVIKKDRRVPHF